MIRLIKSTFHKEKDTKEKLVKFLMDAEKLSFGDECIKFENKFADWQGREYCSFLNSGSSANLAIIQALMNLGRLKKGDMVGFSALTWSTNVMPLIELGLVPIPLDVELDTLNISSRSLLNVIEKHNIRLLFVTNLLGFCHDLDVVKYICGREGITLIEDNCESLGSVYNNTKLGNFGLASTFSFYVGHHMSTIEGGAVCTDDEELASMLGVVRAHGWDRNLTREEQNKIRDMHDVNSTFYSRYTFYDLGYNLRPTEINGFIGNIQIDYLDEVIEKRRKNYEEMALPIYKQTDKYYPIKHSHMDFNSNFAIPVICKTQKLRNELVEKCDGKVEIRPVVGGDITQQPFYKRHMGIYSEALGDSVAGLVHRQGLYFGNNPELTRKEKDLIVSIFT